MNDAPITFAAVSDISGVAVSTLYYHRDITRRIQSLREEYSSVHSTIKRRQTASTREVMRLRKRVATLEHQVEELQSDNEALRKLIRSFDGVDDLPSEYDYLIYY